MQSTLGLTLLRLIEPDEPPELTGNNASFGKIFVDGVDVSTLPLAQLRSAIGCVPQEPMLIGGLTIAEVGPIAKWILSSSSTAYTPVVQNLDPCGTVPRDAMWEALEECSVAAMVRALPKGLDTPMADGGSYLAAGNRQLLCFARMLLHKPRIILLDEATASLDQVSDASILRAIVACSRFSTILNIAHRLHTSERGHGRFEASLIPQRYFVMLCFCSYAS